MNEKQFKASKHLATALMVGTVLTTTQLAIVGHADENVNSTDRQEQAQQTLTIKCLLPDGNEHDVNFTGTPGTEISSRKQLNSAFGLNVSSKYLLANGGQFEYLPEQVTIPQHSQTVEWRLVNRYVEDQRERTVIINVVHQDLDGKVIGSDEQVQFRFLAKYEVDRLNDHIFNAKYQPVEGPDIFVPKTITGYIALDPEDIRLDPLNLISIDAKDRNNVFLKGEGPVKLDVVVKYKAVDNGQNSGENHGYDGHETEKQPNHGHEEQPNEVPDGDSSKEEQPSQPTDNPDNKDEEQSPEVTNPNQEIDNNHQDNNEHEQEETTEEPDDSNQNEDHEHSATEQPTDKQEGSTNSGPTGTVDENKGNSAISKENEDAKRLKEENDKLNQLANQPSPANANDKLPQAGNQQQSIWVALGGMLTGLFGLSFVFSKRHQN